MEPKLYKREEILNSLKKLIKKIFSNNNYNHLYLLHNHKELTLLIQKHQGLAHITYLNKMMKLRMIRKRKSLLTLGIFLKEILIFFSEIKRHLIACQLIKIICKLNNLLH